GRGLDPLDERPVGEHGADVGGKPRHGSPSPSERDETVLAPVRHATGDQQSFRLDRRARPTEADQRYASSSADSEKSSSGTNRRANPAFVPGLHGARSQEAAPGTSQSRRSLGKAQPTPTRACNRSGSARRRALAPSNTTRPRSMTTARSASSSATSVRCSTSTMVLACSARNRAI